jgi:VWFA-related protein
MKNSKRLLQSISLRAVRLLFLLPLLAATQDAPPTIRTETRAVQIDVAVRDAHGVPVRQLTKDDFTLLDNGKPRAIEFFSAEESEPVPDAAPPATPSSSPSTPRVLSNTAPSNAPREAVTVILLDASSPTLDLTTASAGLGLLASARQGAFDAMAKLPVKERIAVYHVSPGGLKIVQDFTTDRDLLRKSINAWTIPIDWRPMCGPGLTGDPNHLGPGMQRQSQAPPDPSNPNPLGCGTPFELIIRMGAISALDSLRIIGEKLAGLPGRKNLIWVTPGFPTRIKDMDDRSKQAVIEQLNDANVALNAIDIRGGSAGRIDDQGQLMQMMTEPTGGKAYLTRNDIAAAIQEVDEAARTNYTLGFYLPDNERDGKFHKLELRVDRPKLSLSYRKGYVAGGMVAGGMVAGDISDIKPANGGPEKEAPETELLDPVDATAIGISATADVTPGQPHPTLHLKLSLDGRGLTLLPHDNGSAFTVSRMVAEMDARGVTLVEAQDSKEFLVPATSADAVHRDGIQIHWEQTLPLMTGAATVRVIVRDKATGQAGTLTVPVADAH